MSSPTETIRYLLLVAALHTPRPPELMVLHEPETSLHPDLVTPLARLIAGAARHTQIVVVTHSSLLLDALAEAGGLRCGTGSGRSPWPRTSARPASKDKDC